MNLDSIGLKYQTDKASWHHNYLNTYEKFFEEIKNDYIHLLEIGVSNGNSLKTWKEYFQNAMIYGVDVNPVCSQFEEERITVRIGDQGDNAFLESVYKEMGKINVIIDDGSHMMHHIKSSFEFLWPRLADNGIYVMEDLHTACLPQYNPNNSQNIMDFLKERIGDLEFNCKNMNSDICGDRTREYNRRQDVIDYTDYEKTIDSIHFFKSICILKKKSL